MTGELDRLRAGIRRLRTDVAALTTVAATYVDQRLTELLADDPTHGDGTVRVAGVPAEHRHSPTADARPKD